MLALFNIVFAILLTGFSGADEAKLITTYVEVEGIKSIEGKLGVLVYQHSEGFPQDADKAILKKEVRVNEQNMSFEIGELPKGEYAIAVMHDINENDNLDRNVLGIPKEPFGFSNNRSIIFGPPSFEKAKVQLDEDQNKIKIELIEI